MAALASAGMLAASSTAGAAPAPTVAQVQARLSQLDSQARILDEKLDQAKQDLQAANQQLGAVNSQVAHFTAQLDAMRTQIGQIAAQTYMQAGLNSSIELLTNGSPQKILDQSSILQEISASNNAAMKQFLGAAQRLQGSQQAAEHTKLGIAALQKSLSGQKQTLNKLISQEQTLLAQLTPAQQANLGPGGGGTGGNPTPVKYTGPTGTQADTAVQFAYSQLNCPYVFGGTGPCGAGYDCSGLVMKAWAAAGISIPRTSEDQWASLPHVSTSALQPGDILVFAGASHVGLYVGGGWLVDAPHSGLSVEKVALSGWYSSNLDGAVRP
jgi:cell wall-associated NlpC family hydrolase